jgi:hypothetical protein
VVYRYPWAWLYAHPFACLVERLFLNSGVFGRDEPARLGRYYGHSELPSGPLQNAWRDQLNDIEQAGNWDQLSVKHYHATCWLAALVQASVIDLPTAVELRKARAIAHQVAGDRLMSTTP